MCLVSLTQSVFAAWDKPCDKRQILEAYWCDACKEVREFNECSEIGYIWDFAKHSAAGDKTHTNLPTVGHVKRLHIAVLILTVKNTVLVCRLRVHVMNVVMILQVKRFGLELYLNVQSVVKKNQSQAKVLPL